MASGLVHAAPLLVAHGSGGCVRSGCDGTTVVAFGIDDLNPLTWLGNGASAIAADAWKSAMIALWSAGLWILGLAFHIVDAFTTPDLSANGPLGSVLPYTFAIGLMVAGVMAFIQIGAALYQRDGRSLARVLVGVVQFGAVWIGYIAVAAALVEATAGLTTGLLQGLLHIDSFGGFSNATSWPRNIDDTVVATVLGICTLFILFPAAVGYVLIMLVREAALMLLTATSPIAAGGLLSEGTRSWFWKTLRWFFASLLICPLAALVLGVGVKITEGTINGQGDKTAAAVGMAVTGSLLILIAAVCPLVLFRLLAFVDPGTASGAAMRQSLAASGGVAGLLGAGGGLGGGQSSGSGAATKQDGQGRAQGESNADAATGSRFASMMGPIGQTVGAGAQVVGNVAAKATSVAADVLGSAGVGHQQPYFGHESTGGMGGFDSGGGGSRAGQAVPGNTGGGGPSGADPGPGDSPPDESGGGTWPHPPTPPAPPSSPAGGVGVEPTGTGGGGASAAGAGAAAEVPIVPL